MVVSVILYKLGRSDTLSVITLCMIQAWKVERGESSVAPSGRAQAESPLTAPSLAPLAADDDSFIFTVREARCLPVCYASASHSNLLRFRATDLA
jgi:hypothetical protein